MTEEALAADSGQGSFDLDSGVGQLGSDLFGVDASQEASHEKDDNTSETPDKQAVGDDDSIQEPSQQIEPRTAPQSWKKEMHDAWGTLTPEVQDYIELREKQMKEGIETDKTDASLGRMMRDVMSPYSQMLQQMQIDEPTMVRNLLSAHYQLSTASPEDKQKLFSQLAQGYGITTDGQQTQQVDPVVKQLQDELNTIKSSLNARDQATLQETRSRVEKEVEAFASEHPLFDEVAEDLVPFLNAGMSLEDAYEKAIWANPVTRDKEMDRLAKEKEAKQLEAAKEKTAKAKKAKSANVSSRDTEKAPTGTLGTMEDTLRDTYRDIQQRN